MSRSALISRRILVVGPALSALAQTAMPQAEVSAVTAEEALAHPVPGAVDLVILDAAGAAQEVMVEVIGALAALRPTPPTLLVGAHLPASLFRALLKLHRSDVLEAPFALADLARAAGELIDGGADEARPKSRCWSVMGAVGGAGATTLAVELATLLAERSGPGQTCLVDLNLADGAAAAYLGATPNLRLGDASVTPSRLDATVLSAFTHRVANGPDLLAAPRDSAAFETVDAATVGRILEVACEVYRWVIVDMPRHRQPWTLDVLAGSDEVIVVSELTVPALLSARALASEIEDALAGVTVPKIVLNRLAGRAFGPSPSLGEAERALQRKADGAITSDWEAAAASVNLGGAISRHRPRSKIVRDVQALLDRMLPVETEVAKPRRRFGR
jgi:pilus assembly protein CpaE